MRPLGVILCVGLVACAGSTPPTSATPRAVVDVQLPRLGGGALSLAALRGHPVVVFMFTTWSLRAQVEAPRVAQLADRYRTAGLRVVGIALDRSAHALIETYVRFVGINFDVGLAEPNDLELIAAFGPTRQVPRTVLLDRAGRVAQDHPEGQTDFRRLDAALRRLLGSPRPAPDND